MAFNKIQPEQIQLHTFFSDSGDLNITQTNTGVKINVSRNLTGDFSFTGDLTNNGKSIASYAQTDDNIYNVNNGNILFLGSDTEIGGGPNDYNNFAISCNDSNISGKNNAVFRADSVEFRTGSQENVCLAGHSVIFTETATGSVVLKDTLATNSITVTQPNSFYAKFTSGHFFQGGDSYFQRSLSVDGTGIFSGQLDVLSDAVLSGSTIVNEKMLNAAHNVTGIVRYQTGFALPIWLGNEMSCADGSPLLEATGALAISGSTLCVFVGGSSWRGIAISGATI